MEAKNLGKTNKTIKTIIFKLSPDGGVAPGDSLKIMVFMVFIGFSNVLGSLCVIFIGFSNVLGSLCVIFIGCSNVLGSLCVTFIGFSNVLGSRRALFIGFSNVSVFWKPKTLEKPIKTIKTIIFQTISRWWCRAWR